MKLVIVYEQQSRHAENTKVARVIAIYSAVFYYDHIEN